MVVLDNRRSRFEGLQKGIVDIECGPNSTDSGALLDKQGNKFSDTIAFSGKDFYQTGTKLLLRKSRARDLANSNPNDFVEKLKNLSIVVAKDTTTFQKLSSKSTFYSKVFSVAASDRFNARDLALDALESGRLEDGTQIEAFASDAVIVQTLYQEGVNEEGDKNQPYYQRYRQPYKNTSPEEFVVFSSKEFPSPLQESYLPYLGLENYAIAVRREDAGKWLGIIDNKVLVDL